MDRTRKLPITVLVLAPGFNTDQKIYDVISDNEYLQNTLEKDNLETTENALLEIYERLRPGEPPTVDNAKSLLETRFFDPKRYDLAHVGRYKINKKLNITNRLLNQTLAEPLADEETGELLAEKGDKIDRKLLNKLIPYFEDESNKLNLKTVQLYNGVLDEDVEVQLVKIVDPTDSENERVLHVVGNAAVSNEVKHITSADILSSISYFFNLLYNVGHTDDIDHLGNRRLRSVGELLQNQFRIGLSRMERVVRERMSIQDTSSITPQQLINIRPVIASIKEFFGSSQLSQFMDQTNPLAELTHKRRL